MAVPRLQVHIQPRVSHLIPAPFIGVTRQDINQPPGASAQLVPGHLNVALRRVVTEIDYDEIPILVLDPAPRDEILIARIVAPARAIAESPIAVAEHRGIDCLEKPVVENLQWLIYMFARSSIEKHR